MALTEEEKSRAAAIVDKWFWQLDESRHYRYKGAVKRIVRYYESAPLSADVFKLVLEHLRTMENVGEISLNHKKVVLDGRWNALGAWYATDAGSKFAGTESTKVRVYQALIQAADGADGEEENIFVVEDGCKQKVTHTFFWDVATPPVAPQSSSGVQRTIQGLTRDRESGLYSYVIETRETVRQDVELYTTAETAFEKRQEEAHLGVKAADLDSAGKSAGAAAGVITRRVVRKNPDCTSDVQNEVIIEKPVENAVVTARKTLRGTMVGKTHRNQAAALETTGLKIGETRRSEKTDGGLHNNMTEMVEAEAAGKIGSRTVETVFEKTEETLTNQLEEPKDAPAAPAGGVVRSRTVRTTEEGTVDVTDTEVTEKPVENAVVVARKSLRGTMIARTNRNQAAALETTGLKIGETRRSEMTDGGLHNTVVEKVESESAGKIAEETTKTLFEHTDETLTNQLEEPTDEVAAAEAGVVQSRTVRTTEEGTIDVSERTVTEQAVPKSRRTTRTTPFRTVVSFRDTAAEKFTGTAPNGFPLDQVKAHAAQTPAADGAGAAREVSLEATRGGLQTTEEVYIFPKAVSWSTPEVSTSFRFKRTWFYRNFSEAQVKELSDAAAQYLKGKVNGWIEAGRPPLNHDVDMQMTLNDDGFYDGAVAVVASWSEDSAGLDGNADYIISDIKFTYWAFNYRSDRYYQSDISDGQVFQGFMGMKITKRRITGYGINALRQILEVGEASPFAGYEPQVAFNSKTYAWTVELVLGIECGNGLNPEFEIPKAEVAPGWVGAKVDSAIEDFQSRFAAQTDVTEPDMSGTKFG